MIYIIFFLFVFFVEASIQTDYEQFENIMNFYYKNDSVGLNRAIQNSNIEDTYLLSRAYYYKGLLYYKNKVYREASENFWYIIEKLTPSLDIEENTLFKLYEIGKNFSELNKLKYVVDRLSEINYEKYEKIRGLFYFDNISKEEGFQYLKYYLRNYADKDISIKLGDYLASISDYENAISFYKGNNNVKFAKALIYANRHEKIKEVLVLLNEDEKKEIETLLAEYKSKNDEKNKVAQYYETAEKSILTNRTDMAKVYFRRVLESPFGIQYRENTVYNLGKLAYLDKNYQSSLDYFLQALKFDNIKRNGEIYYNLGIIYASMGKNIEAQNYFEKVVEEYPFTFWETKAKIQLLKIKK